MPIDSRQFATVANLVAERKSWLTESALRWQIFNAQTNGLAEAGAIVRVPGGSRVIIDVQKYDRWLESGMLKKSG